MQALSPRATARLAEEAARLCLDSPGEREEAALLLCDLATLPHPQLSRSGADGIFHHAVESMADAFEPRFCDLYIQFFARVVEYCKSLPDGQWLDQRLRYFGLRTEQDLIRRAVGLRFPRKTGLPDSVKKVLVLSRVTLGADVAITSLVLQKMMRAFPQARVVLLAGKKSELLFAGESRIVVRRAEYPRGGGLLERLAAWPVVVDAVQEELADLGPREYLVIDPDSRLTQLGMLPVLREESAYRFFESRSFSREGYETLADLTGAWLGEVFGPDSAPLHPWVSLPPEAMRFAGAVRGTSPESRWVSINFGVGDNPGKRLDDLFEHRLLTAMLERGWHILLDKGEGEEEIVRAERRLAALREAGYHVAEIRADGGPPPAGARVVAWRGSLAGFGALIGVSDLYVGYDSACQHIAAALGVNTVDIFAGFRSLRMTQRWRPSGPAEVRLVVVDPHSRSDPDQVLALVLEAVR